MNKDQHITYKYRVKNTNIKYLMSHAKACNVIWNYCVDVQKHTFKWNQRWPNAFDLSRLTTGIGAEIGIRSETVNSVCRQFVRSRNQIRKCPRYRGKNSLGWVPFISRIMKVRTDYVTYKKRKYRFWKSREMHGEYISGSFNQDARGRWYINLIHKLPCEKSGNMQEIGVDLGLKSFATLSNGEIIGNPRHFRTLEKKLAVAQRAGKKKRAKAIHAKIANCRHDFHHKQSTRLANQFGRIVVGNVNSGKLAKTRMAKSVLDAGWWSFRTQLTYKMRLRGGEYIEGDERYSTQTCSNCGIVGGPKGRKGLGVRTWICGDCGASHDRDHNAAINILKFAMKLHRPSAGISSSTL